MDNEISRLRDENTKLRVLIYLTDTCNRYASMCEYCPMMVYGFDHEPYCDVQDDIRKLKEELGI